MNMRTNSGVKQEIFRKVRKLPVEYLQEIDYYVHSLIRIKKSVRREKKSFSSSADDPLIAFIGLADAEPFSQAIDQELYGDSF